ncbi:MAG TPA: tetratricopeptide repeat protein [Candidatus Eisenbacteria bacterium]
MTQAKRPRPAARPARPPRPSGSPGPAASASEGPHRLLVAALFFLMAIPLYANTIGHQYALDDAMVITQNAYTKRGVEGIVDILTHDSFAGFPLVAKDLVSGGRYRPLSIVTFALEYQVAGASPHLSHAVNLVLYGITGALLYLLLARLLPPKARSRWWMSPAFLVTLLYMAHPLHTEIVANIKGRDEILAFLFALAGFHAYLSYEERAEGRGNLDLAAGGLFLFLGLLAKESVFPFFVIIPLGLWFFRRTRGRRLGVAVAGMVVPLAVYFAARTAFAGSMKWVRTVEILNDPFAFASFSQRVATVFETFGIYLRLFLFPHPLTHDYYYDQVPLTDFGHVSSLLPAAIAIGLAVVAVAGIRRRSPIAFGLLFFAFGFSIVSNLFMSIGTTMAERFLYIPSLGLAIAFVYAIYALAEKMGRPTGARAASVLLIAMSTAFAAKTVARNRDWKDNLTLFTADLAASSRSAKEQGDLASTLASMADEEKDPAVRQQLVDDAILHFRKAIEIYPEHSLAWFGLGNVLAKQGTARLPEAIECYRHVVSLEPRKAVAYLELALAADRLGDHATALENVRRYRSLKPEDSEVELLEATYLERNGQVDSAIVSCEGLIRREPRNAAALAEAGRLLATYRHDYPGAAAYMSRSLAIDSTKSATYENLGSLQILIGEPRVAVQTLERGLARFGDTYLLNWNLGGAWQRLGDPAKSARYFARAREISGTPH